MKCPVCVGTDLLISERQGIEIDYCPKCRGVWLDRGELDKIIERSEQPMAAQPGPAPAAHPAQPYPTHQGYSRSSDSSGHLPPVPPPGHHGGYQTQRPFDDPKSRPHQGYGHQAYPKKKKSFWSEIFD